MKILFPLLSFIMVVPLQAMQTSPSHAIESITLAQTNSLCTICQENIEPSHTERIFECSHSLHNSCYSSAIDNAIRENKDFDCPSCRRPMLTNVPLASPSEMIALWMTINTNPNMIDSMPDGLVKERCLRFANLIHRNTTLLPETRNELLSALFVENITACITMPRLETIIGQRNSLERSLSIALEKVNIYEKETPKIRPLVSRIVHQRTELRKLGKKVTDIETLQEKIARKKRKIRKESELNAALGPAYCKSILTNFRLRLGITGLSSILTGVCVRTFFGNSQAPATKLGIAAGLAVATVGFTMSCVKLSNAYKDLKQAFEKYQSQ